jgi:ribonuclease P protein component
MLPKDRRIRTGAEISAAFSKGRAYHGKHATIRVLPSTGAAPRFGFIVSRRVSPSAVVRNRVKRQLRAAAAEASGETSPAQVLVVAKPAATERTQPELQDELIELLKKATLIRS